MADDDDDESFGDFTFAPQTFPTSIKPSQQINDQNDDVWGDFVAQRPTLTPPGHVRSQSLPIWEKPKGALPLSLFGVEEEESGVTSDFKVVLDPFGAKSKSSESIVSSGGIVFGDNLKRNELGGGKNVGDSKIFDPFGGKNGQGLKTVDPLGGIVHDRAKAKSSELVFGGNVEDLFIGDGLMKTESNVPLGGKNVQDSVFGVVHDREKSKSSESVLGGNVEDLFFGDSFKRTGSNVPLGGKNVQDSVFGDNLRKSGSNVALGGKNVQDSVFGNDLRRTGSNVPFGSFGFDDIMVNLFSQKEEMKKPGNVSWNSAYAVDNGLFSGVESKSCESNVSSVGAGSGTNDIMENFYGQGQLTNNGNKVSVSVVKNGLVDRSNGPDLFDNLGGDNEDEFDDGWEFKGAESDSKSRNDMASSGVIFDPLNLGNGSQPDHIASASDGVFTGSYKMGNDFDFKPSPAAPNGIISDSLFHPVWMDVGTGLHSHPLSKDANSVGNSGKFEASFSEAGSEHKEATQSSLYPVTLANGSHRTIDLFAGPNAFSSESNKMDIGFDFRQPVVSQDGVISDPYFQPVLKDREISLNSYPISNDADSDENFGEFEDASSETKVKLKGNDASPENYKGAMPLSIFGVEEPVDDDSSDILHDIIFQTASPSKNVKIQNLNLSINDILSDLYSQAEPISSADSKLRSTENGLDSTDKKVANYLLDGDEIFDNGTWEFNEAVSQPRVENLNSVPCAVETKQNLSSSIKQNDYVDFYSKLKDKLLFVARCHIDCLKKAQSTAALSGEDEKAAVLDEEVQAVCEELCQEYMISKEALLDEHFPRDKCLDEYLEILREPKLQALESEYDLSRRLLIAGSTLESTVELIKHSTTMLSILNLVSMEEKAGYVSSWLSMISICAQELRHGASILEQSLEKNAQNQVLSSPKGKQFFLALGEIYRIAVILGASVKFYKPWILLSLADSKGIYAPLEECHTLWSTSGLQQTLQSISDTKDTKYDGDVNSLVNSIESIRGLGEIEIAKAIYEHQESFCQLSLLPAGIVPDMKMVVWDGKNYFQTIANLWANMISRDPPHFPCLHPG